MDTFIVIISSRILIILEDMQEGKQEHVHFISNS